MLMELEERMEDLGATFKLFDQLAELAPGSAVQDQDQDADEADS